MFAWQQGGDGGDDGPLNAIAAAAERTQHEPGGRGTMRVIVSTPKKPKSFTIAGPVVFNGEGRTREVLLTHGGSHGPAKLEAVTDGTVMYMHSGLFGTLPGGAKWMAIDLSLGQESETPAGVDARVNWSSSKR